ncbi:MAG: type II toxin-antitoxin system VapC family toxin [Oscillospiraceae bacterium]|nr:type II toxin-antitoxin system VapC family toxin [Oscillospiraceae bacterium]
MKYLLDTHTFLWCFEGSNKLSETVKNILLNEDTARYVSTVSLWEFLIKHSKGKLPFEGGFMNLCRLIEEYEFFILPMTEQHIITLMDLPFIDNHKDPFDRLLVATAKAENMTILTADENIHKYDVSFIW